MTSTSTSSTSLVDSVADCLAVLPRTKKSATACTITPVPPPTIASSIMPASSNSFSALYPRSLRFCKNAALASCAASAPPVVNALRIRLPPSRTVLPPIFLANLVKPGILRIRAKGITSNEPIAAPLSVAADRSSSVAPAARARSLASPAPAPIPTAPAPIKPAIPVPSAPTPSAPAPYAVPAATPSAPATEPRPEAIW